MKNYFLIVFIVTFLFGNKNPTYHIPIKGTIDMGLPYYIERAIVEAESNNGSVIIFEIDTFGGRVDAATKIKDLILNTEISSIAFINKRAISAGALIALSCDSIFMTEGASIGAATAVDLKGKKASEKVISYMREEMASTAEATNRLRSIAAAMVDEELNIDYIVNVDGDTITSKNVEGFKKGKLITLSSELALSLGISNKNLKNVDEILTYMNLNNSKQIIIMETWSEKLVRFLTNPAVAPLFMSLGMLGLFFEIKSPGFGFPGIIGLCCLSLFFGSHLLVGLAEFSEVILLCIGLLLILIELFVIPGFGFVGIVGFLISIYSFYQMLIGTYPLPQDYQEAYLGLFLGMFSSFIAVIIIYKTIPNTQFYKELIPFTPQKSTLGYSISKGFEKLIGEKGQALTDLRPSGKIEISGKMYHALSHGDYIEKDKEVLVDGINENQLLVKKYDDN